MEFNYSISLITDRIKILEKEIKEYRDWLNKNSKNPNYYINHECDVACCLSFSIGEKDELEEAIKLLKNKNSVKMEKMRFCNTKEIGYGTTIPVFPLHIKNDKYEKLLVIQSKPCEKYWFQDKEITMEELIEILSNVKF